MQTIYIGEDRLNGRPRIKMTDTKDCLPVEAFRVETRIFPNDAEIFRVGIAYQKRGFEVCIDTTTIDCYEFGQDELAKSKTETKREQVK